MLTLSQLNGHCWRIEQHYIHNIDQPNPDCIENQSVDMLLDVKSCGGLTHRNTAFNPAYRTGKQIWTSVLQRWNMTNKSIMLWSHVSQIYQYIEAGILDLSRRQVGILRISAATFMLDPVVSCGKCSKSKVGILRCMFSFSKGSSAKTWGRTLDRIYRLELTWEYALACIASQPDYGYALNSYKR